MSPRTQDLLDEQAGRRWGDAPQWPRAACTASRRPADAERELCRRAPGARKPNGPVIALTTQNNAEGRLPTGFGGGDEPGFNVPPALIVTSSRGIVGNLHDPFGESQLFTGMFWAGEKPRASAPSDSIRKMPARGPADRVSGGKGHTRPPGGKRSRSCPGRQSVRAVRCLLLSAAVRGAVGGTPDRWPGELPSSVPLCKAGQLRKSMVSRAANSLSCPASKASTSQRMMSVQPPSSSRPAGRGHGRAAPERSRR